MVTTQASVSRGGAASRGLLLLLAAVFLLGGVTASRAQVSGETYPLTTNVPTRQANVARFAIIGDFGTNSVAEGDVANMVKSWNPDFVVTLGDNNYELGEASTIDVNIGKFYHQFISPYLGSYGAGAASNQFFPCLGNHDWGDGYIFPATCKPYTDYFTLPGNERYYDYTSGPVHLFAVDSDDHEPDGFTSTSPQAQWLQARMLGSSSPWKLVYFHHPPYCGADHGSVTYMRWPFQEWGAAAVFSGHSHVYERLNSGGLPYFVNGLGGGSRGGFIALLPESQVRYNADNGAQLVVASGDSITIQFITRTGLLIDSYTMNTPTPAQPTNLTATSVSSSQVQLAWSDNGTREEGFLIERSDATHPFAQIAAVPANTTSYLDNGLVAGATYTYRVRSYRSGSPSSSYSNTADATTFDATPDAPSGLTAVLATASQADLSWTDNSASEDGFEIERSQDGGAFTLIGGVGANATAYSDAGLLPGTAYSYRVRAVNANGVPSSYSNVATVTTTPAAPTQLTASAVSSTQIDLAWHGSSTGADTFTIERSLDNSTFAPVDTIDGDLTAYSSTGLIPNTTYFFRVYGSKNGSRSASSNTASAATLPAPPNAPNALIATAVSSTRIQLSWADNSSDEDGFRIYRSSNGTSFSAIVTVGPNVTSYINFGRSTNTRYWYRVRAYNGGGESADSNTATATTPAAPTTSPTAPTNLVATAVSSSQINLTWTDNSTTEEGFYIERSTNGTSFTQVKTVEVNSTSWEDTGRPAKTTYYYRVRAYNSVGTSAYSNVANATTLAVAAQPPAAPTNLTATAVSSSQINLIWTDASTSETGFKIERSPDGVAFSEIGTVNANVTTYASVGLAPLTRYYYRVRAYNSAGNSGYSNTASDTTLTTPPNPPTGLNTEADRLAEIDLAWADNSDNEDGFRVERSLDGVNFTRIAALGPNVTFFADTGLATETRYYYRVQAYNSVGDSAYSNVATDVTLPSPPSPPAGLTATTVSTSRISLAWTDTTTNEDSFRIDRSLDGITFTQVGTVGTNVTTFLDVNLLPGTTYLYRVLSHNAAGDSVYSNTASAATLPNPPAAPTSLTATAVSSSRIDLAWVDNSTNEDGFRIERSPDGVTFTEIGTVGAGVTGYSSVGLTAATAYTYRVRAYNLGGNSGYSNTARATTLDPPAAPAGLTATGISTNQIDLAWVDNSSDEDGFRIERSPDGVTFTEIGTVGAGVIAYSDTGLVTATLYTYRVRAYNTGGSSPYSNTASASTLGNPYPNAPSGLTATAVSSTRIQLEWADNSDNEDGFRIYRSTNGTTFSGIITVGPNVTSYINFGRSTNTRYWYRVRAYNGAGESADSNTASATTPAAPTAPPAAPTNLVATAVSSSQISLTWADNSTTEEGFYIERSTNGTSFTQVKTVEVNSTSWDDTGRPARTTYYYRVRAYNSVGTSAYSNVASAATLVAAIQAPARPRRLARAGSSTGAREAPAAHGRGTWRASGFTMPGWTQRDRVRALATIADPGRIPRSACANVSGPVGGRYQVRWRRG